MMFFSKMKIKPDCDELTDFYDKNIPKVDSNHTYLAVISFDCALTKRWGLLSLIVFERAKYIHWEEKN